MRSTGSGPLGALLMLAPLIAVPILAVVGIPQFAPGNLLDSGGSNSRPSSRERRAPEEQDYGDDARYDANDLFVKADSSDAGTDGFDDPLETRPRGRSGRGGRPKSFENENEDSTFDFENDSKIDEEPDSPELDRNDTDRKPGREDIDEPEEEDEADSDYGEQAPSSEANRDHQARPRRPKQTAGIDPQFNELDNPFEAQPKNKTRPRPKSPEPSNDPNDAPIFDPPARDRDLEEVEPKASPLLKRGVTSEKDVDHSSPPAADIPEDEPESMPDVDPAIESTETAPQLNELNWQTASKRLRALGVGRTKQHFTYMEDRNLFLFTCTAIHNDDPARTKRFQADADEPLLAVRQVLEQLESWQDSGTKLKMRPLTNRRTTSL